MKMGEIYMISCTETNKKYIGQTRCTRAGKPWSAEHRWKTHVQNALHGNVKRCRALCNAINKYGPEKFSIKTILICEESKLNYFEVKYIRQYKTMAPYGYNLTMGGSAGNWSEESRERLRQAKLGEKNCRYGVKLSDEVKHKISDGNRGKTRSDAYKEAMALIKKNAKPENHGLPKYIYHYRSRGSEGYKIFKHPVIPKTIFTAKSLTMEEKLTQAITYLNNHS
jgi:group I intron endonuclease